MALRRAWKGLASGFQDLPTPSMVLPWAFIGLHGTTMRLPRVAMTTPRQHCHDLDGARLALLWALMDLHGTVMSIHNRHWQCHRSAIKAYDSGTGVP